jgi:hypothetical protein
MLIIVILPTTITMTIIIGQRQRPVLPVFCQLWTVGTAILASMGIMSARTRQIVLVKNVRSASQMRQQRWCASAAGMTVTVKEPVSAFLS